VPLSEHEQRLLEQIEQALYDEDPKFASIYRGNDLRSHQRRRLVRAAIGLAIGLGVLLAGVITKLIALGVAGFVLMLVGASFAVASWQRMAGPRSSAAPARSRGVREPKRSVVQRLEDRWQRRQDER
jgi:Flp pilus assembly protein TadB